MCASQWSACLILFFLLQTTSYTQASSLLVSIGKSTRMPDEVEADYQSAHLFINEVAGDNVPITLFFDPMVNNVAAAEIFSNLNRRDRASLDANGDGIQDGIVPPPANSIAAGDDHNYYKAYSMQAAAGGFQLTLSASKCGAYRLTARYRLENDPPGTCHWYNDERGANGLLKRDCAIVVSPKRARDLQLYEINPLTIAARGVTLDQRGTFSALTTEASSEGGSLFNLSYVKALGCTTLWLQPIHPRGIAGRGNDPTTSQPYELGSPYSVKNFFAVMPLMAKGATADPSASQGDTPEGRAKAMAEFQDFVRRADAASIDIMLDAPFNHTSQDVELNANGQAYWGNSSSSATNELRQVEARVFSRLDEYDTRASNAGSVAHAPDRYDFSSVPPNYGKWLDVSDVYFGRYAALVPNRDQIEVYKREGDWFDYTVGNENGTGDGNGHFDSITMNVWRYFADYLQFWLTQTAYPSNEAGLSLDTHAGIDGLRADFAQGLPPQCWEYIINRTRARKWDFIFMAESLDGGAVTYRSSRHFDVLNDNLIYQLHHVTGSSGFKQVCDNERGSYHSAVVLLNTSSQDEDNYKDPFQALMRFAVNSSMDGATMIFPGQELGLSGTIIPPSDSVASAGPPFGYERYESGFAGKPIPQFKTFNSMMPLWNKLRQKDPLTVNLLNLYRAIGQARASSPALRSPQRRYLNPIGGTVNEKIFGVAKMQQRNADPTKSDVVFAFVNITLDADQETKNGEWFGVDIDADGDGANDFGIKPDHKYNVKNIAAFTAVDPQRRGAWLWGNARMGSDLLKNGLFVHLNRVPIDSSTWATAPYEPQYLKLYDVTEGVR